MTTDPKRSQPDETEPPDYYREEILINGDLIEVGAQVWVDENDLYVDGAMFYPVGAERIDLGAHVVLFIIRRILLPKAAEMGADAVVVRYSRTTGANPGRTVEKRFPLSSGSDDG